MKKNKRKQKTPTHGFPPHRSCSLSCMTLESAAVLKGVLRPLLKEIPLRLLESPKWILREPLERKSCIPSPSAVWLCGVLSQPQGLRKYWPTKWRHLSPIFIHVALTSLSDYSVCLFLSHVQRGKKTNLWWGWRFREQLGKEERTV